MTDLTQIVRWNTGFMRGLAESVLNRAKTIRSTLAPYTAAAAPKVAAATKSKTTTGKGKGKATGSRKTTAKRTSSKATAKKGKRTATKQ
jgi:hypothetical protein